MIDRKRWWPSIGIKSFNCELKNTPVKRGYFLFEFYRFFLFAVEKIAE